MASKWADFLLEGSFKKVKCHFLSTKEEHGRDVDRREYISRDGVEIKDRGRKGLPIEVRVVCFEDSYPETMFQLIAAVDEGGPGELVHPIFGTIQVVCERCVVTHDAEEPDSAIIDLSFIEDTQTQGIVFESDSQAALAGLVRAAADEVDVAAVKMDEYLSSLGDEP